ncbi:MAG TPA: hypothetical protein VGF42_06940 [Caulobacteraceae bacterium]
MRKVHLITTALGATVLAIGVAQAGPMGGGPTSGMGAPPAQQSPSGPMGVNGAADQNANTDTCGDNTATRIPCTHHATKAKAKTKGAASADTSGANANADAKTGAAASASAPGAAATTNPPSGDSPH